MKFERDLYLHSLSFLASDNDYFKTSCFSINFVNI